MSFSSALSAADTQHRGGILSWKPGYHPPPQQSVPPGSGGEVGVYAFGTSDVPELQRW